MIDKALKMGIRVAVFDENKAFLEGVRDLLKHHDDIDVIAVKENGKRAVELAQVVLKPDVIVLDVGLPSKVKIEAIRTFIREIPSAKVLALGIETDKRLIARALEAGAAGYICKYRVFEDLASAIRAVVAGHGQIDARSQATRNSNNPTKESGI